MKMCCGVSLSRTAWGDWNIAAHRGPCCRAGGSVKTRRWGAFLLLNEHFFRRETRIHTINTLFKSTFQHNKDPQKSCSAASVKISNRTVCQCVLMHICMWRSPYLPLWLLWCITYYVTKERLNFSGTKFRSSRWTRPHVACLSFLSSHGLVWSVFRRESESIYSIRLKLSEIHQY